MKLTIDLNHRDEIECAMVVLLGILNPSVDKPKETATTKVTVTKKKTEKPEAPAAHYEPPSEDKPAPPAQLPFTRQDLGQHLRGIALKYGDAAQTAIGEIVLARSGTQALSQVDETLLPVIKEAVDAWVDAQS